MNDNWKVVKFTIATDGAGAYTSTSLDGLVGSGGPYLLHAVEWVDGNQDNGVDFTLSITDTPSGVDRSVLVVANADNDAWYQPRIYGNNPADGATWANGADVTASYAELVVTGRLKLAVTNGGATKAGACFVYLKKS